MGVARGFFYFELTALLSCFDNDSDHEIIVKF